MHEKNSNLDEDYVFNEAECLAVASFSEALHDISVARVGSLVNNASLKMSASYWQKRAAYEQDRQTITDEGSELGDFYFQGLPKPRLDILDARKRLHVYSSYEQLEIGENDLNPALFGLNRDRIEIDRKIVNQAEETYQDQLREDRNTAQRQRVLDSFKEYIDTTISDFPAVSQLIISDFFHPVSLLERPIRKATIAPTLARAIGCIAQMDYLEAIEGDQEEEERLIMGFKKSQTERSSEKIIATYNGNVGAVIGIKLPVCPIFMDINFPKVSELVIPGSLVRLQFDAVLTPTGRKPYISRLNAVTYQIIRENGKRKIASTIRKSEKIDLETAVLSLVAESETVSGSFDADAYRDLAGIAT